MKRYAQEKHIARRKQKLCTLRTGWCERQRGKYRKNNPMYRCRCGWCRNGTMHATVKRKFAADEQIRDRQHSVTCHEDDALFAELYEYDTYWSKLGELLEKYR